VLAKSRQVPVEKWIMCKRNYRNWPVIRLTVNPE
jgi:hypothetical protein